MPSRCGPIRPTDTSRDLQWVAFQDRSGSWQLRALQFCSRDDRCPKSFDAWLGIQVERAILTAAPLVLLLVLGGWLVALWLRPDEYLRGIRQDKDVSFTTIRKR